MKETKIKQTSMLNTQLSLGLNYKKKAERNNRTVELSNNTVVLFK